jgi:hypothetical protein
VEALVDHASRAVLADGRGLALVDAAVADAFDALEAERCISIALECLQQVGGPHLWSHSRVYTSKIQNM